MRSFICIAVLAVLMVPVVSWAQEESTDTLSALVGLLKDSDDPQFQLDILKGMSEALKGRAGVKMPAGWQEVSEKLSKSANSEVKSLTQSLSTLFGDVASTDRLKATVGDAKADAQARKRALGALLDAKTAGLGPALLEWVADPVVRAEALRGLAAYDDARTPEVVLKLYPSLRPEEKLAGLNALASREEWSLKLLEALKSGAVPRTEVTAATIRQLSELNNDVINKWIAENWGAVRTTAEDKLKEIEKYKVMLGEAPKKGVKENVANGRVVFARICAQCHQLFGEGGKVGPDLTGSGRAESDYVLQNVVDPNAVIGKDYQMMVIRMKGKGRQREGRLINGIVTREDEHGITVATDTEVLVLPKEEILRSKQSDVSMMPEGLMQQLAEQEFVDLLAYLRSPEQVAFPPGYEPPAAVPVQQN